MNFIYKNENIETISKNMKIIVSNEHKFNTDTILLADFSMPKNKERSLELGSGCGAISLIWYSRGYKNKTTAIEIQKSACDMFKRSIKLNNLENLIQIINLDLKKFKNSLNYDLVVCNPPYKKKFTGLISDDLSRATARYEKECDIKDIIKLSKKVLNFSGRLCMCSRTERLCDIIVCMRENSIEPKKIRFVQQRKEKSPKLFLIEGRKGGNAGIVTMPTLFIESEEIKKIYGDYGECNL